MTADGAGLDRRRKSRRTIAVGCGLLLVTIAISVGVAFVQLTTLPPPEPDTRVLPAPNGYDAIKAAVQSLAPTPANSPIYAQNPSASALRAALTPDLPALEKLHQALKRPYMTPASESHPFLTFASRAQIGEGALKLYGRGRLEAIEGRSSEEMTTFLDVIALGIKQPRGCGLTDALTGNEWVVYGGDAALDLAPYLGEAELRTHRSRLEDLIRETVGEREILTEERRALLADFRTRPGPPLLNCFLFRQSDQVLKEAVRQTEIPLELRESRAAGSSIMGRTLVPMLRELKTGLDKRDRLLATLRLKMGVEEFRTSRFRPPENLDGMIPDIFPEIPIDPATKQPLKYYRKGDAYQIASPE